MQSGFEKVLLYPAGTRFYQSTHYDKDALGTPDLNPVVDSGLVDTANVPAAAMRLDCSGMQCPGPIMKVFESMKDLKDGQVMEVAASDPGFVRDIGAWCRRTGNTLVLTERRGTDYVALVKKGGAGKAPMIWSGGMAWIADFPDPANFYYGILGCSGAVEGGWNWSKYCNEVLDAKAVEADSMFDPAKSEERLELWSDVYMGVMEDAAWAPVFNEERYTMKSERLGGADELFVDPVSIPVNYDYVWVKE